MHKEMIRKLYRNKRTNQLSITLPKKRLPKRKSYENYLPKKIKIKDWE
jgi:hypothetical protein